jgi:PAS domain S-box-containing protein
MSWITQRLQHLQTFLLPALLYFVGVAAFCTWHYLDTRDKLIADIDKRLGISAAAVPAILPADFHNPDKLQHGISKQENHRITLLLSSYARQIGAKYVYTLLAQGDNLYFTSSSATDAELRRGDYLSFMEAYPEASPEMKRGLASGNPFQISYTDRWGSFRTACKPYSSSSGQRYAACADEEISHINGILQHEIHASFAVGLIFILLVIPFLLASYRRQQKHVAALQVEIRQRSQAEADIRALNAELDQRVKLRTDELGDTIKRLQQEILERRLSEQEQRKFAALVENSTELIGIFSLDGQLRYINPAGRKLSGIATDVAIDSLSITELLPEEWRQRARQDLLPRLQQGPLEIEVPLCNRSDGRLIDTLQTVFLVQDPHTSQAQCIAVVARDIRERKRHEQSLAQAKDIAESAARAKDEFLANMSHEIRTPMNGIIGMVGLLQDTGLNDEQNEFVELLRRSADSLLRVIDDMLDISRIEAGQLEIHEAEFNLPELLEETMRPFQPGVDRKQLTLSLQLSDDVPHAVIGDSARLRRVLTHLLSNALKYTDKGNITFQVSSINDNSDVTQLRFSISDTGIGIAPELQQSIFAPFTQADASATRRQGGTGLGLTLAQRLVQLMGGHIEVESTPGQGSTFSFSLCLARLPDSYHQPQETILATHQHGRRQLSILVAEDNFINQTLIGSLLEHLGHQVTLVDNGQQAVEAQRQQVFDLILMDVQMPVMDGLVATRSIRDYEAENGLPPTPVIALTANNREGDRQRCLRAGMNDFIAKPVSREALLKAFGTLESHVSN